MTDFDLPDLPSDKDLGITDEDHEFLKEMGEDRPEMSDAEMKALLGDSPPAPKPTTEKSAKPDRAAARAAKKAAKAARKEEKRQAAEEKKRAKAKNGEKAKPDGDAPLTDSQRAENLARSLGAATSASGGGPEGATGAPPKKSDSKPKPVATAPEPPRSRWRGPAMLAALIVLTVVSSSRTGVPRPVAANAPDTAFSSSRAMSTLIEIATEAHPTGSPEHARVREYLGDRFASLGLEPEIQTTTTILEFGPFARAVTVRNIVARIPGTDPTGAVLMTAHYDGRDLSVAASDDGVGVVTIVEAIRALTAGEPLRNDVIVLITDAEELGLAGARAFVDEHPLMEDVSIVLSFEMRGSAGPSIMFETNDQNGWVVRALDEFDAYPFANSMVFEVYRRMPNDTDFTPFREAGKQGLNFAAIDNAHVYHQEYDTPQTLSEATLQHHGYRALAAARYFGEADLTSVDAPNVVYFSVPVLGLIVYGQMWVLALSGALLLLLVGTFVLAKRSGARATRVGVATGVGVVTAAVAFGAVYALVGWLPRFHAEAGSLHGSIYHREGWYMIAVAGIAFTAVTGIYGIARRWLSPVELGFGAVVIPLVAAIAVGFWAPFAAMNLQWPVLAALVSLGTFALLGPRTNGIVGWVAALVLTAPVLFLLVPVVELVWLALTFRMAAALGVMVVLALLLCIPAIESLRHPNSWWAPTAGLVVIAAAIGLGILTSRPNGERPAPSTLIYAYEHGTGSALWVTDARADSLDRDAIAWAEARAGGPFEGRRDMAPFALIGGQSPTAPAQVASADPPEVLLTRDTIDGGTRRVTLAVRSRLGAEYMAFMYDERGDTRLVSINGMEISEPADLVRAEHWGTPDPAVVLELEMPADEAIGLHIIEHLLRPEEILDPLVFDRPPDLAPDITRLSDRAVFRYSVGAFADPRHAITLPGAGADPTVPSTELTVDTIGAPADSLPVDTLGSASQPDTGTVGAEPVAQPDTAGAVPDTAGAVPDTIGAVPDTAGAIPDTANMSSGPRAVARRPGTSGLFGR